MKSLVLASAITLLAPAVAHADQCQWISSAAATKAEGLLAEYPNVIAFCEPCGEQVPGVPRVAHQVSVASPHAGYKEISVNGEAIDLAYTYVQTSRERYQNLAMLAGCPVGGVSPSLAVADETDDGVMITADTTPVTPPAEPAPEPAVAEPPPPPPAPTQVHYYSTTIEQPLPWLVLALAAGGGVLAGGGIALTALALRRRRAMRPRATDL